MEYVGGLMRIVQFRLDKSVDGLLKRLVKSRKGRAILRGHAGHQAGKLSIVSHTFIRLMRRNLLQLAL